MQREDNQALFTYFLSGNCARFARFGILLRVVRFHHDTAADIVRIILDLARLAAL